MRQRAPSGLIGALYLFVQFVGCTYLRAPQAFSGDQIAETIRALPKDAHFSLSGVAFFKDKLYVSTNVGLLVLDGGKPETLYKWRPNDDVVEGPWVDVANDALWIRHVHYGTLGRFDGTSWHRVGLPVPPEGYSRGDMLDGFLGIGSPTAFWLVGGNAVWRFQVAGDSWVLEPRPPAPQYSATRAVAPSSAAMLYVVREGFEGTWHSRYAVYDREDRWARQSLSEEMEFGGAITTREGAYVRAKDGRLFVIGPNTVRIIETPGQCEAIAQTSTGRLLASFVDRGIFLLDNDLWDLQAAYPYGQQEGEHWAYLTESDGQIAYATSSVPQLEEGRTVYSGSVALWVQRAGELEQVILN